MCHLSLLSQGGVQTAWEPARVGGGWIRGRRMTLVMARNVMGSPRCEEGACVTTGGNPPKMVCALCVVDW